MFLPETGNNQLKGHGSKTAKIAIVGDYTTGFDIKNRRPFSGPAGSVLEVCLHQAGLIRAEVYTTNLIKERVGKKELFFNERKTKFTERAYPYLDQLREELEACDANIIVAAGKMAFAALCSLGHLTQYRGYIFESTLLPGRKVIPTQSPSEAVRGMYVYRYIISSDLKKAKDESDFPEVRRPERRLIYQYGSLNDALEVLKFYETEPQIGFDIEVLHYEVSCISFASTADLSCVIPFGEPWTIQEEVQLWRGIQGVLGNPNSTKIVQNGMFDIPFLLIQNGVVTRGPIHDTMLGHHIVYPELPKGLGFLGSIYCGTQEYWKDTVKFKSIKDND